MIEVFNEHLNVKATPPKNAIIKWLNHLLLKIPHLVIIVLFDLLFFDINILYFDLLAFYVS